MPYLFTCTIQCDNFASVCGNQIAGMASIIGGQVVGVAPGVKPVDWTVGDRSILCPFCIGQLQQLHAPVGIPIGPGQPDEEA